MEASTDDTKRAARIHGTGERVEILLVIKARAVDKFAIPGFLNRLGSGNYVEDAGVAQCSNIRLKQRRILRGQEAEQIGVGAHKAVSIPIDSSGHCEYDASEDDDREPGL
jgi:hypothetical protein